VAGRPTPGLGHADRALVRNTGPISKASAAVSRRKSPSFDISHGFEGSAIQLKDGKWIDGRIISDGDPVVITSTGGFTQKVPKKQIASRKDMDRSLMLNADQLGMSA
jgi:putative heme-binding domain-containing protein